MQHISLINNPCPALLWQESYSHKGSQSEQIYHIWGHIYVVSISKEKRHQNVRKVSQANYVTLLKLHHYVSRGKMSYCI